MKLGRFLICEVSGNEEEYTVLPPHIVEPEDALISFSAFWQSKSEREKEEVTCYLQKTMPGDDGLLDIDRAETFAVKRMKRRGSYGRIH